MTEFTFKPGDRVAFNHAFLSFIGHPNADRVGVAAHRDARGTILAVAPDMSAADGSQLIDVQWDGEVWSRMGLIGRISTVQSSNLDLADAPEHDGDENLCEDCWAAKVAQQLHTYLVTTRQTIIRTYTVTNCESFEEARGMVQSMIDNWEDDEREEQYEVDLSDEQVTGSILLRDCCATSYQDAHAPGCTANDDAR